MNDFRLRTRTILAAFAAAGLMISLSGCGPTKAGMEARKELKGKHDANLAALAAQSARQDFRVGNLEQSLNNIEAAIGFEPDNDSYFVLRGRILIEMNELQEARESLLQAQRLNADNADAYYYIGLIFQRWSKPEQAADVYYQAWQLAPTSEDYALAYVETLVSLQRFEEADRFLAETYTEFEHDPAFRIIEGHIRLMQERPNDAAEAFYQAMLLDPEDLSAVESLVYAYIQAGDYAKAEYYLERMLKDPETSDRRDLKRMAARCLAASDRLVEAREMYIDLINEDRSDLVVWYELGIVSLKMGDTNRVENAARTLISTWPRRPEGYVLRGRLSELNENWVEAIRDYKTAASLGSESEEILLLLGMAVEKTGELEDARNVYRHTLALYPDSVEAERLLGNLTEGRTAAVDSP